MRGNDVSPSASVGSRIFSKGKIPLFVIRTFLWTTGGKTHAGRFLNDNTIIRYYLDDSATPQLEFFMGAAAGSFVHLESKSYYSTQYDGKTGRPGPQCNPKPAPTDPVYAQGPYCGMDLADSDTNDGT